jgi:hypothetical protein
LARSDKASKLPDTADQGNLLTFACVDRRRQLKFGATILNSNHTGAGGHGLDINHQDLAIGEVGDITPNNLLRRKKLICKTMSKNVISQLTLIG